MWARTGRTGATADGIGAACGAGARGSRDRGIQLQTSLVRPAGSMAGRRAAAARRRADGDASGKVGE